MNYQEFPTPDESAPDFSKSIEESELTSLRDFDSKPNIRRMKLSAAKLLNPPLIRNADDWARDKRVLPEGSAEPGEWSSSRVPWVTKIHQRIADTTRITKRAVAVFGSQMSKTDGICLNGAGHRLDEDPTPVLYIGPTKSNIDNVIEPRVDKMFKSVPSLRAKLRTGRKSKKHVKEIGAVSFRMAWAGSATELASQPAGMVIIDEVDRMKEVEGEGDVVTLGEARMATYPDGLLILDSSPTIGSVETYIHPETGIEHWREAPRDDIQSPIWWYWQEGTREEWAVPCLHCQKYFVPRHKLLVFSSHQGALEASRTAVLACPYCGGTHAESDKNEMNSRGEFLAPGQNVDENGQKTGVLPENEISSFWVSGLMSPWVSFGTSAARWIRAVESGESAKIQAVLNTRFGELFKLKGEAPPWEEVKRSAVGLYSDDIPEWIQRIYLTVDVQLGRLIWNVRGWGVGFRSRLLREGTIYGDTDQQGTWDEFDELYQAGIGDRHFNRVAIDSGYRATRVYEFCQKYPGICIPTKGVENPRKIYQASDIEVDVRGKKRLLSIKLWAIDSGYFKSWVHDRIKNGNERGIIWEVPSDVSDDYCRQLVAEARMVLPSGRVKWIRQHRENHQLDCEALQIFLANMGDVRALKTVEQKKKVRSLAEIAAGLNSED